MNASEKMVESSLFARNPSKRWGELYFLAYAVIWISEMALIVASGIYEVITANFVNILKVIALFVSYLGGSTSFFHFTIPEMYSLGVQRRNIHACWTYYLRTMHCISHFLSWRGQILN